MKRPFINSNPHLHKEKEMVDFRKAFLLLVVVFVAVASAQVTPLSCNANSGVPPIARAEGVAEEVGQVIINCTGGTPTAYGSVIPTINVQIFLNTNVTSRLLVDKSTASEALLLIDEPTYPSSPQNGVVGTQLGNPFGTIPVVKGTGSGMYYGGATSATAGVGAEIAGNRPNVFQAQQAGANSVVWLGVPFDPPGTSINRVIRLVNVRANANQLGVSSTL
ncbi:MAG: hypothetical protein HZB13_10985, partial [Acidobacteria bacterium]|nr:hypothetical protein [Acidobacteriota bacterium]